jgi:thiol-disulfide isomerase/thioredoxin
VISAAAGNAESTTHALLINGGSRPQANYLSHLHHLEEMVELLEYRGVARERIHVFSADGEDQAADLAARDPKPEGFWLIEGTRLERRLRPQTRIIDTRWAGVTLHPARKSGLRAWFQGARKTLAPGDRLLIFVTDHGKGNDQDPDNGTISLWQEEISVDQFRELLERLPRGVRAVMVMSQCYSGTFANAIFAKDRSEPTGEACGFFSTTQDLKAYGCYPEGRDKDRIGHAFRFIEALDRQPTTEAAHLEVLITDNTPDVPLRTSDLYLQRLLEREAESRGMEFGALVDSLLTEAWRERASWEPEIRLLDRIGNAFGAFSPRSLAELESYQRELPPLIEQMKTYADRWKATVESVKAENLVSFARAQPEWRDRLQEEALKDLDNDARGKLLAQLLPELEWHAMDRPELWLRLEDLRNRAERAAQARWRLEVRRGAVLRMRSILVGIAGQVLLAEEAEAGRRAERREAQRQALGELLSCEASEPGLLPASSLAASTPLIEPFPPLAEELELLQEILPSWLGVRFNTASESVRTARGLNAGATLIQQVYPDSPASEGGLEPGDLVLGPPERPFDAPGQLREWTMTSQRETPLQLRVLRPASRIEDDLEFEATLYLRPLPLEWPELPGPPQIGDRAPSLPYGLEPVGSSGLPELSGRPHLLFFWATWCLPCKKAVPELLAYAANEGISVLAISDEDPQTVAEHLEKHGQDFFDEVAVDPLRKSFITWGVSGTPTIVLVDAEGIIRHRQTGYQADEGLSISGWTWSGS